MTIQTYRSPRGHALLFVEAPISVPVLTLENYTKWYEPYLVMPDGTVVKVRIEDIEAVMDTHSDALWSDHLYHPRFLYRLAKRLKADLDERAVEVALGRWMLESGRCDEEAAYLKFNEPES